MSEPTPDRTERRWWLRVALLVVSVAVSLLLAELVARTVLSRAGTESESAAASPAGPESTPARRARLTDIRLSPLVGFQRVPGRSLREQYEPEKLAALGVPDEDSTWQEISTNNLGLFDVHDLPYRAAPDEYVVAISGGSVAHWFTLLEGRELAEWLERRPEVRGRRVVVLNLAAGAYKQPQQLHLLADLLAQGQRFDLVVNLDGFNEIGLNRGNAKKGLSLALPEAGRMLGLAALASAQFDRARFLGVARVVELSEREDRLAALRRSCRLALCRALRDVQLARVRKVLDAAREEEHAPDAGTSLLELGRSRAQRRRNHLPEAVAIWAESSRLIHDLLAPRGAVYLHVLQPNQYFSHHEFGAEEKRIAFTKWLWYRGEVQAGYPMLLDRAESLRQAGVAFASAVGVFDAEPEAIFVDDCCHFNRRGNRLLLAFIERELERVLPPTPP